MACFVAPLAEAVAVAVYEKVIERKCRVADSSLQKEKLSSKAAGLKSLRRMLFSGSALLVFEHIWHGEIVLSFPFVTAGGNAVLYEIMTTGVLMAVAVTGVWGIIRLVSRLNRARKAALTA